MYLIERQTTRILGETQKITEDKRILTILVLHIESAEQTEGKEMIEHLHKPQNTLMHQKTKQIIL